MTNDTKTSESLAYSGKVKATLMSGRKKLLTRTFHNAGCRTLFRFLCNALAGNYAEDIRPCKIALFKKTTADVSMLKPDFSEQAKITPYVITDSTAVVKSTDDSYTVTYHFRIPNAFIETSGTTAIPIVKMALYGKNPSSSSDDKAAYILITNDEKTAYDETAIVVEPSKNISLVVEWTMEISNTAAETKTTASTTEDTSATTENTDGTAEEAAA